MKVIPVKTDSEDVVYVAVSEDIEIMEGGGPGGEIAASPGEVAASMLQRMDDVGRIVADVCRSIRREMLEKLQDVTPSELTLEFAITLAGEAGVPLVTKSSVEGTFKVSAKWKFDDSAKREEA